MFFGDLNCVSEPIVRDTVDSPAASDCKQSQLSFSYFALEEFKHRLRMNTRQPLLFRHWRLPTQRTRSGDSMMRIFSWSKSRRKRVRPSNSERRGLSPPWSI